MTADTEKTKHAKAVSKGLFEEKSMSPNESNERVEKSHPSWMGIPALDSTEKMTGVHTFRGINGHRVACTFGGQVRQRVAPAEEKLESCHGPGRCPFAFAFVVGATPKVKRAP